MCYDILPVRDEEDGVLVAKEAVMEKRKVQEAVSAWQAEKRRRVEDGEEEEGGEGGADDEDVQDVQVYTAVRYLWNNQIKAYKKVL